MIDPGRMKWSTVRTTVLSGIVRHVGHVYPALLLVADASAADDPLFALAVGALREHLEHETRHIGLYAEQPHFHRT